MIDPTINYLALIVAALIPNVIGAIYYGPLFGNMWRGALGKTEEELAPSNPALVYGGALLLSFILAFILNFFLQMGHKNVSEAGELIVASNNTFGHGAFHGSMIALSIVMPVIVSLGLFHKTHWKVNLLNVLFWWLCIALMGGIIDVWP